MNAFRKQPTTFHDPSGVSPRRTVARAASFLVALFTADFVIFAIGEKFLGGGLPVDVWGTYAAWASALVPAGAVWATVSMWLSDRSASEWRETWQAANQIRLEQRSGDGVWLVNNSQESLQILRHDPPQSNLEGQGLVRPGCDALQGTIEGFVSVEGLVRGRHFEFSLNSLPLLKQ